MCTPTCFDTLSQYINITVTITDLTLLGQYSVKNTVQPHLMSEATATKSLSLQYVTALLLV